MKEKEPRNKMRVRRGEPWLNLPTDAIPLKGDDIPRDFADFEIEFLEAVVGQDPCEESSLVLLGHLYTRRGEYQKGLEVDRRLTRLRPGDPLAYYNLACSLSLTGSTDEAFKVLEQALALGYEDYGHLMEDDDLANLRADPRFKAFCQRFGIFRRRPSET